MEASTFRNYCGIIMSRQGYQKYASGISEKASFLPNNNSHATRERLWFTLGRRDVIVICVKMQNFVYDEFIEAGLLKDISEMQDFQNNDSFSDYVYHLIYGKSHRIHLCNRIRNVLSTSQERYRWCGAENESLTNPNIIKRAIEINGMSLKHAYFNSNAELLGQCLKYRYEPLFQEMRMEIEALSSEGQKKLFSCMMGFASPYVPIVYVGSSPGEGWIRALNMLNYSSEVTSIDPRPLQIPLGCSLNITHHQRAILSSDELLEICENMRFFDLIWDVRGDTESENYEDRLYEISEEISILNDILSNVVLRQKIKRMQIKINTRSVDKYLLPDNVRLYMQPFCSSRKIFELRAVAHFDEITTLIHISSNLTRTLHQRVVESSSSEEDLDLANCLGMRLARYNFLHMKSLYNAEIDIALFCINWNTTEAIIEYLNRNNEESIQTICSFFTKPMLSREEYIFPEDYLLNIDHYFVVDSRCFIKAKIECLYFIVPRMSWKMYTNEFLTSETYTIKACEKTILRNDRMSQYNDMRHDTCLESGAIFPKFPKPFSYADKLVSPSGHMLRMMLAVSSGMASSFMMYGKIIANFKSASPTYVNHCRWREDDPLILKGRMIYENLDRFKTIASDIEDKSNVVWHSVEEWILGIKCAVKMEERLAPLSLVFERKLLSCIKTKKKGSEVYTFLQRARINTNARLQLTREDSRKTGISSTLSLTERLKLLFTHRETKLIEEKLR